jgi:putative transposase
MPRRLRAAAGGMLYHVLNRAVARSTIFQTPGDYLALEKILIELHARLPTRMLSYCLMPNHFHFILWPHDDGQLSEFMRLLTVTHTQRYHAFHQSAGTGPLYQGRFKSFPIQRDEHLLAVCRYVERNSKRANLVDRAQDWPWSSLHQRATTPPWLMQLNDWPIDVPPDWTHFVNRAQSPAEEQAITQSLRRGRPFGDDQWTSKTATKLDLHSTLIPRGRPRVRPIKDSRPL